jgi:hypothetical protein
LKPVELPRIRLDLTGKDELLAVAPIR